MHNKYDKHDFKTNTSANTTPCVDPQLGAGNPSVIVQELRLLVLGGLLPLHGQSRIEESLFTSDI